MRIQKNILLAFLSLFSIVCSSQSTDYDFNSPEIREQIEKLKIHIEENEMAPHLKKIKSDFAIDTFKIGYYQRKFPSTKVSLGTSLKVIKNTCNMYDSLIDKYFKLLQTSLKNQDYKDIIDSQDSWEKYRQKEISFFRRQIDEELDFEYNFYFHYKPILKARLETLFFYYVAFKDFKYRKND